MCGLLASASIRRRMTRFREMKLTLSFQVRFHFWFSLSRLSSIHIVSLESDETSPLGHWSVDESAEPTGRVICFSSVWFEFCGILCFTVCTCRGVGHSRGAASPGLQRLRAGVPRLLYLIFGLFLHQVVTDFAFSEQEPHSVFLNSSPVPWATASSSSVDTARIGPGPNLNGAGLGVGSGHLLGNSGSGSFLS